MARYLGPRCKLSRREQSDLGLIAVRPLNSKCHADLLPGQHGSKGARLTDFAKQLREKQKIRRIYGVLEKQFRRYVALAGQMKGATGENLLQILERRLDNTVYRLGFASTRAEARQLVSHGSMLVNGERVNIPSYFVKEGDVIEIRDKAKTQLRIKAALEMAQQRGFPSWVDVDVKKMSGALKYIPTSSDLPPDLNVNQVIELYSK